MISVMINTNANLLLFSSLVVEDLKNYLNSLLIKLLV